MTDVLLPLPVVLPLLAGALSLLLGGHRRPQRVLGVVICTGVLAASVALLAVTEAQGTVATQLGDWPAPIGITLVADRFSAVMLTIAAAMVLAVLVYALGQLDPAREDAFFHPVYLVLTAGVSAAFLTGDLFNLFVAFEVMLTASYVLLTLGGSAEQVRAGMTYIVISLLASLLFVTAVALVYAATGTVNLADLAGRLDAVPDGLRTALGLLLLCVFGVKAAIFPLFFWLPDAYPTAPAPITALFAGLLTKVGVYAIFRTQTLLFSAGEPSLVLLAIAGATMLVGVLGAIAQNDIKRILSFHIISQIGYMILGLGLFSLAGVAGGILYIVHHIVVKTALFLVAGIVETGTGTAALTRLSGINHRAPIAGLLFLPVALSLAGIPPFSGFVAKLTLVQAGLALDRDIVIGVSLAVGLLTLFSMTKIWSGVFWGDPTERVAEAGPFTLRAPMVGATAALVVLSLAIAVGSGPLWGLSQRAAADLLDPAGYVSVVLGA
ncbi:MAG: proton-conducting transporter membrane subunit [Egibacteraceae bacterium]